MNRSAEALIELRNRTLDAYVDGRISDDRSRADLDAIAIELDRILSPDRQGHLEGRVARVIGAILADSRARQTVTPPAKAARIEFWRRRRLERLRRKDPAADEADARQEPELGDTEPDEVRMARPVLAALRNAAAVRGAPDRLRAIADRPVPASSPRHSPASPDVTWTDDDRLIWEEFIGGVPCQGCGRPFLGDETSQREGESWAAYRERMAPIEAAFRARHPDHGTSWTVGGGPTHCRRCCAPHPLSPEQIRQINRIVNPPTPPAPAPEVRVRQCGTCHKSLAADHVCQLDDLPKRLRAVVEAVLAEERQQERQWRDGSPPDDRLDQAMKSAAPILFCFPWPSAGLQPAYPTEFTERPRYPRAQLRPAAGFSRCSDRPPGLGDSPPPRP